MVQQSETDTSSQEGRRSLHNSNFERIRRHFQYNPDFKSADKSPLLDVINEYGAQDGYFFVAPTKPEFSVRKLSRIQERLADHLGLTFESDFSSREGQDGGIHFGLIRANDPLFEIKRQTTITEIEEGSAGRMGIKEGVTSKELSGTIRRMVFVRLYPHISLAEIACYATEYKKLGGNFDHYLGRLPHNINKEQLALFRKLSERGLSWYEIRDVLIAKGLERDINEIAQRNRRNITVGSRVSIDF